MELFIDLNIKKTKSRIFISPGIYNIVREKMKILLFVSSHCPHCPRAEVVVKNVAPGYHEHGVRFEKIRIKTGKGKQLSKRFNIRSMPTILILNDDEVEVQRIVGVPTENNLKNKIERELGLKKPLLTRIFGR